MKNFQSESYIEKCFSPDGISGKQSQQWQVSSLVKDEFPRTNSRYRSLRFVLSNCGLWFLESLSITEIKPKVLSIQAYSIIIIIIIFIILFLFLLLFFNDSVSFVGKVFLDAEAEFKARHGLREVRKLEKC